MSTPGAPVKNVLLDINGVLYNSGEDIPLEGSVHAMERLVQNNFNICLVTNECTTAKRKLVKKLRDLGYHMIEPEQIVSPAPVAAQYILDKDLVPRLHVWDGVLEDFKQVVDKMKKDKTRNRLDCIVVGDIMTSLSQELMDESLEMMIKFGSDRAPEVITLGGGRYYRDLDRLRMDTGAYAAAFCYALGVEKPTCLGKPSAEFFNQALKVVGGTPSDTIMIGDDIISDVGGAQAVGMRGYLVRTGKYIPADETDRGVKADGVFDNLADIVDRIIMKTPPFEVVDV